MTTTMASSDEAVAAVTAALGDFDHARLPAFLVAQIAVESAREALQAELQEVVSALESEIETLRTALSNRP